LSEVRAEALAVRASRSVAAALAVQQIRQAREAQAALAAARDRRVRALQASAIGTALAAARAPMPTRAAPPARVPRPATAQVRRTESAAQRGARVLASLHYPWQRLGYRVEFLPAKAGYLGQTDFDDRVVEIYVRIAESDLVLAHSIAHELGHVLDFTRGSAATRALYLSTRGLGRSLAWFGCSGCTDFRTPAGDWAEVFAYWLAGPGDFRSELAGPPTPRQLAVLRLVFSI
jgi:hypothetical protein